MRETLAVTRFGADPCLGPNWPAGGEIDIIEGVNDYTNNQATLHTNPGCGLASSDPKALSISGNLVGTTDCGVSSTSNQGCGIQASSNVTYGAGFNSIGGGIYASESPSQMRYKVVAYTIGMLVQWDTSGISVFFFPRSSIPADIQAEAPQPSTWGLAMARWPAIDCDPFKFFQDHVAIFDTTLWFVILRKRPSRTILNKICYCSGDWAGGVWSSSGAPGQEQSCAARTGYATCQDFVQNDGTAFQEACASLPVSWKLFPWLTRANSFQTGKLYRISDTSWSRHDTHAYLTPLLRLHSHSLSHCSCSSQRPHEVPNRCIQ